MYVSQLIFSVDIPHFKEVILMALSCNFCGFKSNEVKSGAGVSDKGTKITLHMTDTIDLSRDILKVQNVTCMYFIYEKFITKLFSHLYNVHVHVFVSK